MWKRYEYAFIGAGALVNKSKPYALWWVPAIQKGWMNAYVKE